MSKQTVGSSADRWQGAPPPRGSGLLPPPSHNQSAVISTSGIVSGGPTPSTSQYHYHQQPYQGGPQGQPLQHQHQHQRKKSLGGGDAPTTDVMPPGKGGAGEHKDRHGYRGGGHQGTSGDITANVIVHQHDLETLESLCSRNPLLCLICNNVYSDPRLLSCYHSFCAKCLPGRLGGKIVCPMCGYVLAFCYFLFLCKV